MSTIRRSNVDARLYQEWLELCGQITRATALTVTETSDQKEERKKKLLRSPEAFCKYYFPHYIDSNFGWFHKRAARKIIDDPNIMAILEWPREHAKSIFANVFMPMQLYAKGELTGMLVISANQDKAITLLSDLQAEFSANERWKNDYGDLAKYGDWREGAFSTTDGIGFWAYGRGQSPRGARKAAKRPNYACIDDIDDKVIVRNEKRVLDTVDYLMEDVLGALSIKGARMVVAGNRIHKKGILAHLVGDIEPGDPKREGITHIKVYAIEDPRTHKKGDPQTGGVPAWPRYTIADFESRRKKQGFRAYRREYFHEHHEEGLVFKREWIQWGKIPAKMDAEIVYTDPSFKHKKNNDYKAVVHIGKKGKYIYIWSAWVRQATVSSMVAVNYDLHKKREANARYYMEANFLQDMLLDDFEQEGEKRGYQMPIRADKRKKPDKEQRIENLSPLFERGLVIFNEKERQSPDMQTLIQQFLGFPYGHDDGPDAVEGGVYYLQKAGRSGKIEPRMGKFTRYSSRN